MAKELSQEQINAINNYSKDIKTLKDYVTAVRKMPGMYVAAGDGGRAYLSMIREIYQNSIDQIIMPESPGDWIYLYYNEITKECRVYDDGLGLPFESITKILTTPNTSGNYVKKKGVYRSSNHGQGSKCTNALSTKLIAESYRYDGRAIRFETENGYPIDHKGGNPWSIPNKQKLQGTHITFWPDEEIIGEVNLSWKTVYKLAKQILARTPIGSHIDFEGVDSQGITHKEKIINKDGIVGDLIEHTTNPICKPIFFKCDTGEMMLEAAFVFDGGGEDGPDSGESVVAFCNTSPTPIGTHIDGTVDGICKWFTKYMNTIYLNTNPNQKNQKGKKSKSLSVVASDIKAGLVLSINAGILEPIFIGQAKEQLGNAEMTPFCRDSVMNYLDEWSKQSPQDLNKLAKYFKDIAELRTKENSEKAKIVNKYTSNVITGYPQKYSRPTKARKEFIIVEGD